MLSLLATAAVVAGTLGREPVMALLANGPWAATPAPPQPVAVRLPPVPRAAAGPSVAVLRQQAHGRVRPQLDVADAQTREAIDEHLAAVNLFFGDAKSRTPRFAKKVLGWSSKWRLVSDKLPGTRDDRHAVFLAKAFNDDLFSPEQLTQAVEQVVKNYTDSVVGIENGMLVRMRADVADLPPAALPEFVDDARLRGAFEHAMAAARAKVGTELRADLSRETLSLIAGEVMTLVAVRLGVSGGILAAGAGSSWATVGIGLVVAVIVDQIVSWVWDVWRDPKADVARKMSDKLEEIRRLIVEGDGAAPGLRARLHALAEKRSQLRRQALAELIDPQEAPQAAPQSQARP